MRKVALFNPAEQSELFQATAAQYGFRPDVIEKDFWVCFLLDHLFHESAFKDAFVFKGGTSLSKSYHVIERFSEDIDLILDWNQVITDDSDPWDDRSKTKQDQYNKHLNELAAEMYRSRMVPQLNAEMMIKLGKNGLFSIDPDDNMVINFYYPQIFTVDYLRSSVRLEIGPLAEWMPSHWTSIQSFASEKYPALFIQPTTSVRTVDVERSFWEKITILHKIAHFPDSKELPPRYARHLYDVYCMGHSSVKESAFQRKELLERDVIFKKKFYYTKSSNYETATLDDIRIVPPEPVLKELERDYSAMRNMIYGYIPDFNDLIQYLR